MGLSKMNEICKLFGVEQFEQFKIRSCRGTVFAQYYHFDNYGLCGPEYGDELAIDMCNLLSGEYDIVKNPDEEPPCDWVEFNVAKMCEGCVNKAKCGLWKTIKERDKQIIKIYSPGGIPVNRTVCEHKKLEGCHADNH